MSVLLAAGAMALAVTEIGCHSQPIAHEAHIGGPATPPFAKFTAPSTQPFAPLIDQQDLANSHVVTPRIIAGAQPEDDRSFQLLRELGIKTIVTVDGAKPDVESAHRYGMRYVHLPIGYDGVSPDEGKAIAKALEELPGPIYVHCHHGKHRAAAAVAVACINNGMLQPEQAEDVLRTFGTGENYKGLWKSAREARRVDDAELAALKIHWVEQAKIPALADAMVSVDQHSDNLKAIQQAGWTTPANHPDLDPPHEALQLQEHFAEILRTDDAKARPQGFRTLLSDAQTGASTLREALSTHPMNAKTVDAAYKQLSTSCTTCHARFRD